MPDSVLPGPAEGDQRLHAARPGGRVHRGGGRQARRGPRQVQRDQAEPRRDPGGTDGKG